MEPGQRRRGRPKSFDSRAPQTIQSLDRALDVLELLADSDGLTLTEIARELDQPAPTIYRILSTLEARQCAETDPQSQNWFIGPTTFRLGSAFLRRSSVVERSRPVMRELMLASGETSNLGIERNGEIVFVSQVETQESIRAFFPPGTQSPMHCSGIGKALLSRYPEERLERFLQRRTLDRFTGQTIVSAAALRADLDISRQRGWALDDEEKARGMRCVAAPIVDVYGEAVAGISVSGPTHRMPEEVIARFGALVREAAEEVSQAIGAPEPG